MTKIQHIGLDIDDTLFDFVGILLPHLNKHTRQNKTIDQITKFNLFELFGNKLTKQDLHNIVQQNKLYSILKFDSSISKFLQEVHDKYQVSYITSRFFFDDYPTNILTKELLSHNGIETENIYFTHTENKTKGELCKRLNIDLFIDDCGENLLDILNKSPSTQVILADRPWNRNYALPRIENISMLKFN